MKTSNYDSYGPLAALIGTWQGEHGADVSPEPDGIENNDYRETLTFEAADDLDNAEEQELWVVRYHQLIYRNRDNKHLHDQVGYWSWNPASGVVMQSVTIPRGVCVLAGGEATSKEDGSIQFEVSAGIDDNDWSLVQSPFMKAKAKTTAYRHTLTVTEDQLHYSQSTMLEIYGKVFDHTDDMMLTRVA